MKSKPSKINPKTIRAYIQNPLPPSSDDVPTKLSLIRLKMIEVSFGLIKMASAASENMMIMSIILSVTMVPNPGPIGILSDLFSITALENSPALGMVMFTKYPIIME